MTSLSGWNQLILAGTMLALYVVSIGIVALFGRTPQRGGTPTVLIFPAGWWYLRRRQRGERPPIARLLDIRSRLREQPTRL